MKRWQESTLIKNLCYNTIYQVLIIIVPFITTPYISRVLGADGVGTYAYTYAVARYFYLFAMLGMNTYGNKSIAKVQNDRRKRSRTFWSLYLFQLCCGGIMFVAYLTYLAIRGGEYRLAALCQLPFLLSALFEVGWFYSGMEKFRFLVTRNAIIKVSAAVAVFCLVKNRGDIGIYILIMSVSTLCSQLSLWPFLSRLIDRVRPSKKEIWEHFKPNCQLFVSVLAVSIYTLMDKVMLEHMAGVTQVGYYENTEKLITMCNGIVGAIGAVMLPRVSFLFEHQQREKILEYLDKSMKYIMILSLALAFGIAGIAREFSVIFFGQEFAVCGNLIIAMAMTTLFYSWENILRTHYLIPGDRDLIFVKGTVYAALTNLLVNLLLIPRFEAMGAVIGTVCAAAVAASYQSVQVRKELDMKGYIRNLIPFACIGAVMYLICRVIGLLLKPHIITLIVQVVVGGGFYVAIALWILYRKKDALWSGFVYQKMR